MGAISRMLSFLLMIGAPGHRDQPITIKFSYAGSRLLQEQLPGRRIRLTDPGGCAHPARAVAIKPTALLELGSARSHCHGNAISFPICVSVAVHELYDC